MTAKIKITFTTEFPFKPNHYEEGTTPEEALAVEINNAKDDPEDFLSSFSISTGDLSVSGELIS